jgi:hypothetical protein
LPPSVAWRLSSVGSDGVGGERPGIIVRTRSDTGCCRFCREPARVSLSLSRRLFEARV